MCSKLNNSQIIEKGCLKCPNLFYGSLSRLLHILFSFWNRKIPCVYLKKYLNSLEVRTYNNKMFVEIIVNCCNIKIVFATFVIGYKSE